MRVASSRHHLVPICNAVNAFYWMTAKLEMLESYHSVTVLFWKMKEVLFGFDAVTASYEQYDW